MTIPLLEPGRIAVVRQRQYLIENVTPPPEVGQATLVALSCLDDDAQGEPLSVLVGTRAGRQSARGRRLASGCREGVRRPAPLRSLPPHLVVELRHGNRPEPLPSTVPRRDPDRPLPARTPSKGPAASSRQPLHRRRRRAREDDRGRPHRPRTPPPAAHRSNCRGLPAVHAGTVARRDGISLRPRVHHPGPRLRDAHAKGARVRRQSLDDPLTVSHLPPSPH